MNISKTQKYISPIDKKYEQNINLIKVRQPQSFIKLDNVVSKSKINMLDILNMSYDLEVYDDMYDTSVGWKLDPNATNFVSDASFGHLILILMNYGIHLNKKGTQIEKNMLIICKNFVKTYYDMIEKLNKSKYLEYSFELDGQNSIKLDEVFNGKYDEQNDKYSCVSCFIKNNIIDIQIKDAQFGLLLKCMNTELKYIISFFQINNYCPDIKEYIIDLSNKLYILINYWNESKTKNQIKFQV